MQGAFTYAKPTGQTPVGIPKENTTTFSNQIMPTKTNGSLNHILFLFWTLYISVVK